MTVRHSVSGGRGDKSGFKALPGIRMENGKDHR